MNSSIKSSGKKKSLQPGFKSSQSCSTASHPAVLQGFTAGVVFLLNIALYKLQIMACGINKIIKLNADFKPLTDMF